MNIRTRRLRRDFEKIRDELAGSEFVSVKVVAGDPPERYRVTYRLSGLMRTQDGVIRPIHEHVADIYLPSGYPKQAPACTMLTPIWHPNIGDYICIGDYWSAGTPLVEIICHIADMIQYRSYNLASPVHKEAAAWAQRHAKSFPIGSCEVMPPEDRPVTRQVEIDIKPPADTFDIILGPIRDRQ